MTGIQTTTTALPQAATSSMATQAVPEPVMREPGVFEYDGERPLLRRLGTGLFGAVTGAVVGALVLTPFMNASPPTTRLGNAVALAVLAVGPVAGFALGAAADPRDTAHARFQDEQRKLDEAFERLHGAATTVHAARVIDEFDADRSGAVELARERDLVITRDGGLYSLKVDTYHGGRIWEAADTAPQDDIVTTLELAALMDRFDLNRNGRLSAEELAAFEQAHPVIRTRR